MYHAPIDLTSNERRRANTQPEVMGEFHPDYELALQPGDVSSSKGTCPDNFMIWDAGEEPEFTDREIYDDCVHFEHHPVWTVVN